MSEPSTPLMRQYAAIKKEHPNALLFFRLGDFYELFFDDAILAARELQITLTSRNKEKGMSIPMCGVPYHAAEGYISKLIRRGFKVAVCEQVEDARLAKTLVRREVTRVVTPGTAADSSLNAEENNFLAAVASVQDRVGFAALDLSTGEFRATEFAGESAGRRIQEELEQLRPKEMLYGSSAPLFDRAIGQENTHAMSSAPPLHRSDAPISPHPRLSGTGWAETPLDDWIFAPDHAIPLLENHFGVLSLEGFGLCRKTGGRFGRGGNPLLHPLHPTRHARSRRPHRILRTPELPGTRRGHRAQPGVDRASLRRHRCRRHSVPLPWMRPSRRWASACCAPGCCVRRSIRPRSTADWMSVEAQVKDTVRREELRRALDGILDLERLLSRVTLETANPRDVLALAASLARIPKVRRRDLAGSVRLPRLTALARDHSTN